jgi:tellurite resistance protein TehA-like permease
VAITVLAGSTILAARGVSPRIERLVPFIEGVVVLTWATATFWFPLMIAIGVWRHIVRRLPLRYHPSYWALVFPLGMYGAATYRMRTNIGLKELAWLPKVTLVVALIAWIAAFIGMLMEGVRWFMRASSRRAPSPVGADGTHLDRPAEAGRGNA